MGCFAFLHGYKVQKRDSGSYSKYCNEKEGITTPSLTVRVIAHKQQTHKRQCTHRNRAVSELEDD